MEVTTINVALDVNLLNQLDFIAKEQAQTRADIINSSIKMYLFQKQKLQELYDYGEEVAKQKNITEEDIFEVIWDCRKKK